MNTKRVEVKRVENSAVIVAAEEDRSGLESEFPFLGNSSKREMEEKKVFSWKLNTTIPVVSCRCNIAVVFTSFKEGGSSTFRSPFFWSTSSFVFNREEQTRPHNTIHTRKKWLYEIEILDAS